MTGRGQRARMRDAPWAAWIFARAFTSEARWLGPVLRERPVLTRLHAAIAWPVFFVLAFLPTAAGGLYMTSRRDGAVVLLPRVSLRKVAGYGAVVGILVVVGFLAGLVTPVLAPPAPVPVVVVILVALLVMLVVVWDAVRGRRSAPGDRWRGTRARTPRGRRRWHMDTAGQLPGTRDSAFDLARELIDTLPAAGDVVLITAANWKLHRIYRRTFTPTGRGRRLYRITPETFTELNSPRA